MERSKQHHRYMLFAALAGFFALLLPAGSHPAYAGPQYALTCSSCHSMPPADDVIRNTTTGGFLGNHAKHNPAVASPADCAVCHGNSGYATGHRSGRIDFTSNIGGSSPLVGKYASGVTFKNQTSLATLGSCASVNCHFETTTG